MSEIHKALAGATIVFDLDGTLVDTAPDLVRALNQVLGEQNISSAPPEAVRHLVGHGARALIEGGAALAGVHIEATRLDDLTERFIDIYRSDIAQLSRPFPGAESMLDSLMGAGATLAVCTNKRTQLSIELLEALGLAFRFAAIVGSDAVSRRKPDPVHLTETVRLAGGRTDRCVMVGDTASDVDAARAAGIPVIAVAFGYGDSTALKADAVVTECSQLPKEAARLLLIR